MDPERIRILQKIARRNTRLAKLVRVTNLKLSTALKSKNSINKRHRNTKLLCKLHRLSAAYFSKDLLKVLAVKKKKVSIRPTELQRAKPSTEPQEAKAPAEPQGAKDLPIQTIKILPTQAIKTLPTQTIKGIPTQGVKSLPGQVSKKLPFTGIKSSSTQGVKGLPVAPAPATVTNAVSSRINVEKKAANTSVETLKPVVATLPPKSKPEGARRKEITGLRQTWPDWCLNKPARGLSNPRFLCYRRAILQVLLNIPDLLHWYEQHTKSTVCQVKTCTMCSFQSLSKAYWTPNTQGRGLNQNLIQFDKSIAALATVFNKPEFRSINVQHDAQEFLGWLLQMFNPLSALQDMTTHKARQAASSLNLKKADSSLRKLSTQCDSLFKLNTQWSRACSRCGTVITSGPAEDEVPLFVTVPCSGNGTLDVAIAAAFKDTVQGVKCDKCGVTGSQNRTKRINSSPQILFISLKRWKTSTHRHKTYQKNTSSMVYPQVLDLSNYVIPPPKKNTPHGCRRLHYQLSSVVYHHGSMDFGHYIARVHGPNGVFELDDESARKTSPKELLSQHNNGFTPMILTYLKTT